jgi:hypothetical protein
MAADPKDQQIERLEDKVKLQDEKLKTINLIRDNERLQIENELLREITRNMYLDRKYMEEYNAFLLGAHTEEEFQKIAEKHATKRTLKTYEQKIFAREVLEKILQEAMSYLEVCNLLNAEIGQGVDLDGPLATTKEK